MLSVGHSATLPRRPDGPRSRLSPRALLLERTSELISESLTSQRNSASANLAATAAQNSAANARSWMAGWAMVLVAAGVGGGQHLGLADDTLRLGRHRSGRPGAL